MASQGSVSKDRHEEGSVFRGHRVYKSVWTPVVSKELNLAQVVELCCAIVNVADRDYGLACHARPVMIQRLFEARRLLRTQCRIPRRINGACVYSREAFIRGNEVHIIIIASGTRTNVPVSGAQNMLATVCDK